MEAPETKARDPVGDVRPSPELLASLDSHLPDPPADLLLVGAGELAEALADRLRDGGRRVVVAESPSTVPPSERLDGVLLVLPPSVPTAERLSAIRERVRAEARLLVLHRFPAEHPDPESPSAPDLMIRRLSETRWVVLDDTPSRPASAGLLVARAAEHRMRAGGPEDEEAILDLFERAFHHRRSPERWRWAYRENPWGNARITLAVDGSDRLAAHYAGYPTPFWSDVDGPGRTLLCHHVGDTMTSPEARRIGRGRTNLLTRTVRHFYAAWCRGRVAFNYGSNTGKIQRFSRRTAGALRVEPIPFRLRSLAVPFDTPGPWRRRLGGWRVETVDPARGLDEQWDALWERVRSSYRFLVARDRRYLEWRFRCAGARPSVWAAFRRRELVGWSSFRREGDRLVWGDALFDPRHPGAVGLLLRAATSSTELGGCETVEGWFPDRPAWWGKILADLGFRSAPEPQDLGLVYVPFEEDPGEAMARHLYYTKADFDLY